MERFRRFERSTVLFIGLLVLSFLMATFDVRSQERGTADVLREATQAIFEPVQRAVDWVTAPIVGFIDGVSSIAGLRDENERLVARIAELESRLADTAGLEARLEELERINDLAPPGDLVAITARIYASSPSDFDNIRFIDKGRDDGVVEGLPVIDEFGLVGRVDLVGDGNARVRLITDPQVTVGVRVQRTGETGWVTGRGDGPMLLEIYRPSATVAAGDLLVTDGSRFPPGIEVATVTEAAKPEAGFALLASAEPAVRISSVEYVKVLIGWSPLDSEPGQPGTPDDVPEGGEGTAR
jgi:rod shape-determining protein MreC